MVRLHAEYKTTTSILTTSPLEAAHVEEREATSFHWKLLLFLLLSLLALNVYAPANPTFSQRCLASLLYVSGFIPYWIHLSQKKPGVPFLPLFGMVYILYYAAPIFLVDKFFAGFDPGRYPLPDVSLEMALLWATTGWLVLLFAYYMWPGGLLPLRVPRFALRWQPDSSKAWLVIVVYFGILAVLLKSLTPLPLILHGAFRFLESFLQFALVGLFILQLKGHLGLSAKLLIWGGVAPLFVVMTISSGMVSQPLLLFLSLLLTYCTLRGRIPWKTVVLTSVLAVLLLAAKGDYRVLAWYGTYSTGNVFEKSALYFRLTTEYVTGHAKAYDESFEIVLRRFSQHGLMNLAWVIQLTPETVPFWGGQTYKPLLWMAVPRFLWPTKPQAAWGQEFGHRYGLLYESDRTTAYNMGQLVEMYANFGVAGVIVGMFLLGLIYRLIYELFGTRPDDEGALLVGVIILVNLLGGIDFDLSVVFGNFVIVLVALIIFARVVGFDPLKKPV